MYQSFWSIIPLLIAFSSWLLVGRTTSCGLHSVPGPWIWSCTNVVRWYYQYFYDFSSVLEDLHKRYGALVRIGPSTVSLNDPTLIANVYDARGKFTKVQIHAEVMIESNADLMKAVSYETLRTVAGSAIKGSVIDVRDEQWVTQLWQSLGRIFMQGQVDAYEDDVKQSCNDLLDEIAKHESVDVFEIMSRFQGDVLMNIAFSKRPELVKSGQNNDALSFHPRFKHWVKWQALPNLEALLFRLPLPLRYMMPQKISPWLKLAEERLHGQIQSTGKPHKARRQDLLARYLEIAVTPGSTLPKDAISRMLASTIQAGVETTAVTITSTICDLCQNVASLEAVRAELSNAKVSPLPEHSQIRQLPLLSSVIKESMRLYPSARILLEREVPHDGVLLHGHFLPRGTIIGCHPRVVNHNEAFYGVDASDFRPERWMIGDQSHIRAMERASVAFGSGKRKCRGRYLAEMIVKKVVATLLINFDVSQSAHVRLRSLPNFNLADHVS